MVGRKCNMKQKDLAEEYLIKAKENAIYFKDGNFPNMPLYQENDIKAAFNAGRESVVENIPELQWEYSWKGIFAQTPICRYCIKLDDSLTCNGIRLRYTVGNVGPAEGYAKRAANRDYKMTIKLALGL